MGMVYGVDDHCRRTRVCLFTINYVSDVFDCLKESL